MTKIKPTKKSLITSCAALLLCFSMLLGTTWAWFTDEATSSGNRIVSGSLKVDLLHLVGEDWISLKKESEHKVFDYDLWEPGYTQVETLKIKNVGNLALSYQLIVGTKVGTEKLGPKGESLADMIDVYVTDGKSSAEDFNTAADNWTKLGTLSEFMCSGNGLLRGYMIPAGATDAQNGEDVGERTVSFALHMQETAGNEYQELSLGDVYLNLLASQYTYENDSFGKDYDSEADVLPLTGRVYFRSLRNALQAIANETFSDSGDCAEQEARATVHWENGQFVVTLLDSVTENAKIEITNDLTLDLNGHAVEFSHTDVGFTVPEGKNVEFCVDGRISGSAIRIFNSDGATAIQLNDGRCIISGGTYEANASGYSTAYGIYIAANAFLEASNCSVIAASPFGLGVHGIHNLGNTEIYNSTIDGLSNYTANDAGTDYGSHSRGVFTSGEMKMTDCHVIGTHSGVVAQGTLLINGGTYEGYGHGGIYFAGTGTTSYVKNAVIRWCEMPDGYYDDGIAGSNYAGMYIGGGAGHDNIVVYMDNCDVYAELQSVVIRGSSGEKNNALYISNSRINTSAKIRIDANNALHIGAGNSFTSAHTRGYGMKVVSNDSYKEIIDSYT